MSIVSCGDHSTSSQAGEPAVINLYGVAQTSENPARLFVIATAVGSQQVRLPLAFDTGSAGVTLNALSIFPSSVVTGNGFVFPPGSTSITYAGVTVTDQQGTRSYGGISGRTEYGNIGYTTVTVGDGRTSVTTSVMPVFLYYAAVSTDTGDEAFPQQQQGWFGVNDAPNAILIPGSVEPAGGYPACAPETTGTCFAVSPFKYLSYSNEVNAGFMLSPTALQTCDISVPENCTPAASLTVGLTSSLESGFSQSPLDCTWQPEQYSGPSMINGYLVCHPDISGFTVSTGSSEFSGHVLFDTGTPSVIINVPTGDAFPQSVAQGASIDLTTPSRFVYPFTVGTGVDSTAITQGSAADSIVGITYFTGKSFFIDFVTNSEGWSTPSN